MRTVAFICATVALHYLFLESVGKRSWVVEKPQKMPLPINLTIDQADVKVAVAAAKQKTPPQQTKHKTQAARSTADKTSSSSKVEVNDQTESPVTVEQPEANTPPTDQENKDKSEAPFTLRVPAPADMKMEVSYTKANSSPTNGFGNLSWNTDGNTYSASLEVGVDLLLTTVNLLQLNSEGKISQDGLAPSLSTDTRRNRSMTAIHFKQDEKNIVFSSSNKIVPMEPGAQDALSILMQLATIGNSDAKRMAAGSSITIQVAEGRDAQTFVFNVIGEESIDSKLHASGALNTVHLIRPPKPGSYNSTLEIWLAPDISWYPVRIKNTESNGTVTLQSVSEIKQRQILAH